MKSYPEKTKRALDINIKIGKRLQKIARMITIELERVGVSNDDAQFSLLVWGPDRVQYVGTATRETSKAAMKELLERWDKPQEELGPLLRPPVDGSGPH